MLLPKPTIISIALKLTALTGICLIAFSVSAQKLDFRFGSEYELTKKATDLSFFGNSKNGFVNLARRDDILYIIRFDPNNLQKTSEKEIKIDNGSKYYQYQQAFSNGDKIYFIHSDWEDKKELLYYDEIDLKKGDFQKQNNKLFEATKMAGHWTNSGITNYNKYQFNFNGDSSFMLVSYRLVPEVRNDKKNYDKIGLYVFDESMKKVWGKEFTMPYTEGIMDNSDFTVDTKGNAYMLSKVYDSESRRELDKASGQPAYHYELLKFSPDISKPSISVLVNADHFINSANILTSGDQMMISGTYSNRKKGLSTAGVFIYTISLDGSVGQYRKGFFPFPKEELQKYEKSSRQRKIDRNDDYEASNIFVRNLVGSPNGEMMIACEEAFIHASSTTSSNSSIPTTVYTYYYNDIITAKINNEGDFIWFKKIPKQQYGHSGISSMSYKLFTDPSGYYFLYLDNPQNLELKENEAPKSFAEGIGHAIITKIDNDGNMKKTVAFNTKEESVTIYPTKFAPIDNNKFIGRAMLKRGLYQPVVIAIK